MSKADPAAAFAALGDRTRLRLVAKLAGGAALSIAALGLDAGMTRQALAKHLRVLEDAGLVVRERAGRESRYTLRPTEIAAMRDYLAGVAARWDDALGRLKAFVET
jgi:DNA-binding transcriptional ArsR family regulator